MKAILFFMTLLLNLNANAQWQWARTADVDTSLYMVAESKDMVVDQVGNTIVVGTFRQKTMIHGTIPLNNYSADTTADVFIVRYDPTGNVLWAKNIGGTEDDEVTGITTDGNGNYYIAGYSYSPTFTAGNNTLNSVNPGLAFLVKIDAAGNFIWLEGVDGARMMAVGTDGSGDVLVTGYFSGPSITLGTIVLNNDMFMEDMFVAQYDASGVIVWANSPVAANNLTISCMGQDISVNANNEIFVSGLYYGDAVFGGDTLSSQGGFLAKYNSTGTPVWAKQTANYSLSVGHFFRVAADGNGNASVNLRDTIARFDGNGNLFWKQGTAAWNVSITDVFCDQAGNSYGIGTFNSSFSLGNSTLTNAGSRDVFFAGFDGSGNILWARGEGTTGDDLGTAIAVTTQGDVFITGGFGGQFLILGTDSLESYGHGNMFVAKRASPLAIDQPTKNARFTVYPNPLISSALLCVNKDLVNGRLILYNSVGMKVKDVPNLSGNTFTIYRGSLPPGSYSFILSEKYQVIGSGKLVIL